MTPQERVNVLVVYAVREYILGKSQERTYNIVCSIKSYQPSENEINEMLQYIRSSHSYDRELIIITNIIPLRGPHE